MKIRIQNTFCHSDKTIEFESGKGQFVTGENGAGKSTTLAAIAAVATHNPDPYEVGKNTLKQYIRKGADEGSVELRIDDNEDNVVIWRPGQGIETPIDAFPISSPQACGMVNFCARIGQIARADMWEGMFLPDNPRELLEPHWQHSPERLTAMVDIITDQGWKSALKAVEAKRTEAKRRWADATKEPYGNKKAADWLPPNWRDELYDASIESVTAQIATLQTDIDKAKVIVAVDDSISERIDELRKTLGETATEYTRLKAEREKRAAELTEAEAELQELERQLADAEAARKAASDIINAKPPYECPHCAAGIIFKGAGKMAAWHPATPAAKKDATEKLGKAKVSISEITSKVNVARENALALATRHQEATEAMMQSRGRTEQLNSEIAAHESKQATASGGNITATAKAALENQLEQARQDELALTAKIKADREHDNVVELDTMCELLGPKGVREGLLKSKMDDIRKIVSKMCESAGWGQVKISDDYSVTIAGQSVMFAAASEKAKAMWALQIASAVLLNDKCVLLDAADILRDGSWDGMVKVVSALAKSKPDMIIVVAATSTECPEGWDCHKI